MPVVDSVVRETLRVAQPHMAMRRNIGPATYINGKLNPTGTYVVYPFSDVHLNAEIYPDRGNSTLRGPQPRHPLNTSVGAEVSHSIHTEAVPLTDVLREDDVPRSSPCQSRAKNHQGDVRPRIPARYREQVRFRYSATKPQLERYSSVSASSGNGQCEVFSHGQRPLISLTLLFQFLSLFLFTSRSRFAEVFNYTYY